MKQKLISLSVLALTALSLTACGTSSKEATVETTTSSSTTKPTEEKKVFAIGDKITFDGEVAITVTSANYTEERNPFSDLNPLHVLVVTYSVENLSSEDYLAWRELDLYVNGKKMESYPVDSFISENISAGRSFDGATVGFAITEEGDYELEVKPSTLGTTAKPQIVAFTVQ